MVVSRPARALALLSVATSMATAATASARPPLGRARQVSVVNGEATSTDRPEHVLLFRARVLDDKGQFVGALVTYRTALALAGPDARMTDDFTRARSRADHLERVVPRVSFSGMLPEGAVLVLDGQELGARERGQMTRVNPGEHSIVVHAPGRRPWNTTFRVEMTDRRAVGVQAGSTEADALDPPSLDARTELGSMGPADRTEETISPFGPRREAPTGYWLRLPMRERHVVSAPTPSAVDAIDPSPIPGRCVLTPCRLVGPGARDDGRIDKKLLGDVMSGTGLNVLSSNGMVMFTAPAGVAPHTRVAAALMPNGTGYVALTGRWLGTGRLASPRPLGSVPGRGSSTIPVQDPRSKHGARGYAPGEQKGSLEAH